MTDFELYLQKRLERIMLVLSAEEICSILGCSRATVYNWKNAPANIPAGSVDAIRMLHMKLKWRIKTAIKHIESAEQGQ